MVRWYKIGYRRIGQGLCGAANQALAQAELIEIVPLTHFSFICPYDKWSALEHRLQELGIDGPTLSFDTQVKGEFEAPTADLDSVKKAIAAHYPASLIETDDTV